MRRLTIVVGDTTDHGGTVTTGAGAGMVEGFAMAHVGSDVLCPLHGPTKIITGQNHIQFHGQPVAVEGDLTSCGARLISLQQGRCWVEGDAGMPNSRVNLSSAAESPAATRFAERTHAQTAPPPPIQTPEIRCDERFRFIDPQRVPLSVLNYAVLQDEQCVAQGMLDEQGQTQRHGGTSPASLSIAITAPSPALE